MQPIFRLFLVLSVTACCLLPAGNAVTHAQKSINSSKNKLADVNKKIDRQKKKIRKVKKKEALVITTLNKIEKQLLSENREVETVNKKIANIHSTIRDVRRKIDGLQQETTQKENYLKKRLRALYKYYRRSGIRILLSASSYNELLKQEKLLSTILTRDSRLFRDSSRRLNKTKSYQTELATKKQSLNTAKEQLLEKRSAIKKTQSKKLSLLKKVKKEKRTQLKTLKELERYSKKLQSLIETLPAKKKKYTSRRTKFSKRKGKLSFPVKGKIISTFGRKDHPELHTFTFQKGINIRADIGTKIKAVYDGNVIFADWFKGYGYMIIIDHGESYYSLSAHASKLLKKVDDVISEGDVIALVGDTNSIQGSCLYFEIRYHGKPQDPLRWLKKKGNR